MILIIRMAALFFLFWVIFKLLKSVAQKVFSKDVTSEPGDAPLIAEMVKDPVCGSFVSMDHAVSFERSGERIYFCSDKCLNEYKDKQ